MKLTTAYYRNIVPAVTVLFLAAIVSSYFLSRRALQHELDLGLLRSKSRIQTYIRLHDRLPEVTAFDDQVIQFRQTAVMKDSVIGDTMQYIPEQHKKHISRKLIFTTMLDGRVWEVTVSQPLEGTRHLTILILEIAIVTVPVSWFLLKLMNAHFVKAAENANRDYRNLKEFSENASHELQTPLAIIRSNLDMMAQEGMTERQSELLQSIYGSVRKMSRLQESLLLLTKIDNRQFNSIDDIRVDLLLVDKVNQLQEILHARNLHCHLELTQTSVPANKELLDILLNNLFSNAIRHNKMDGEIYAELQTHCLRMSNTGSDEALDRSRIFRRFYKQAGRPDSNGLGLSIIKQICDTTAMQVEYGFDEGRHSFTISW